MCAIGETRLSEGGIASMPLWVSGLAGQDQLLSCFLASHQRRPAIRTKLIREKVKVRRMLTVRSDRHDSSQLQLLLSPHPV